MKNMVIFTSLAIGMIFNLTANPAAQVIAIYETQHFADEYVKIKSSELTPAVIEEILKQYPTSKLGAAYKNSKGEFKLVMVLKSGTRRTVFIDQYGNWINKK